MMDVSFSIPSLATRNKPVGIGSLKPLLWRDPSDRSSLFQDAAGTVPVTSSGDPVLRMNNKGALGGYFLAPSPAAAPIYATDGTHHWLESDGVDDVLQFQGTVPFSVSVFEAVAFRTISIQRSFAHIVSNKGSARQPLISTPQSQPNRVTVAFGSSPINVNTSASLIGVDVVVTGANDLATRVANVNGIVVSGSGAALTDSSAAPYQVYGPNAANIRDYGGVHMNRVPSDDELALVRAFYAAQSGGVA
ncbi:MULTISPECIES: hypothetical protein [unclassified Ruegeria]|uniref:hypothetical protein n=1 Tax=unclassified Ruegeria TaxID=2625375 RepID=UPI001ADB3CE5|nr:MULTISPECIES: hypothetical protein [unclassified Ruegeria]MBO9411901.1 hypothetical protein [Ruegeria sp. R8_1]MBO9415538.1 hypothetical protein [Ruegeria sp. R8_2]